jgi:hypothetical protein
MNLISEQKEAALELSGRLEKKLHFKDEDHEALIQGVFDEGVPLRIKNYFFIGR